MNRTKTFALGLLLSTGLLAGTAMARPGGGGGGQMREVLQQLDLTEAQRESLKEMRQDNAKGDHKADREKMRGIQEKIKAELMLDAPNAKKIHALVDQKLALQAAHAHDRADRMIELSAILTPEQRVELAEALDERREKHRAERPGR